MFFLKYEIISIVFKIVLNYLFNIFYLLFYIIKINFIINYELKSFFNKIVFGIHNYYTTFILIIILNQYKNIKLFLIF